MSDLEIELVIRKCLKMLLHININDINNEQYLEDIGLDSLNMVRLIVMLEEKFDIVFDIENLVSSNFESINKIINIIKESLQNGYIKNLN